MSVPDDCLFCRLVREGDHVARADGFVAIRDVNPQAETHLLVLPERHVQVPAEGRRLPQRRDQLAIEVVHLDRRQPQAA